jgi:hypothetical protein
VSLFRDLLDAWSGGVVTSTGADKVGKHTSPRGRNSFLDDAGPTGASPAKRRGISTVNTSQIAATAIIGQHPYRQLSGGTFTRYHLINGADGKFGYVASDPGGAGTYTSLATGYANARPSYASALNVAFMVNGTERIKVRGTAVELFGIEAPASAPSLAVGSAGAPTGTYEARVTYYNANSGHESSAGPTSSPVTVTADDIDFSSIPTSADAQVTARRIYLRNTATQANFYLAATIADNTTTTYVYDQADTLLITTGPDADSNDRPPSGVKYLAWHRSRMFAADDTTLYYSAINKPEAFDAEAVERVNPQDGQRITGLYSAGDLLLIFKTRSLYALYGVDPESWQVRLLSPDVGCVAHQSITAADSALYWWSQQGPMRWDGAGAPTNIGLPLLGDRIDNTALAFGEQDDIVAGVDPIRQHVVFAVAEFGKTRNTLLLPWSYRLGCWVSDGWDPLGGVASLATIEDDTGRPWLYMGSYAGQVFRAWDTDTDGVPSGTVTGTFVAGGSSITTITSSGFYTTGSALVERMVSIEASDGTLVARRYITTNSSTVLTLDSAVTVTSGATYTFHVGGPNFEWDTRQEDSGMPFVQKRFEFLYVGVTAGTGTVGVHIYANSNTGSPKTTSFSSVSSTLSSVFRRLRVAKTGKCWQARIYNRAAATPLALDSVGMRGVTLSDHIR